MAGFLRPLMLRPPPALGSKRPGDLLGLLREAGRAAGLSKRDVHDFYRVMTMSVGDLLDDWFENDLFKGATASTGVVGVWAGPRTPGTAYNLLHHALGEIDGVPGLWGHRRRRPSPAASSRRRQLHALRSAVMARRHPVDLRRPAARLVAPQVLDDLVGEVLGAGQVEHRRLRVRARDDQRRPSAPRRRPA